MSKFTHINKKGLPGMVNVGDKMVTKRRAEARTKMFLGKEIIAQFEGKDIDTKKGPVFQTAIIAGTMAVKQTSNLIPLCHPLQISGVDIIINILDEENIEILCAVEISGKTGVEMEALTGASLTALTIYDMCKAFGQHMIIKDTRLVEKTGGKSDLVKK
ncbi:MAG: cyclic pyranopterin phosphate synthase [Flavobacteriaceae bacterium]|jgi:cyclic pyranopterin phosphate synthase